jgi:hypothetical protein
MARCGHSRFVYDSITGGPGAGPSDRELAVMKKRLLVAAGVLIALVGFIWTLQGLGYIGGSGMSGVTLWAVIGPVVVAVGIAVAASGMRRRRPGP